MTRTVAATTASSGGGTDAVVESVAAELDAILTRLTELTDLATADTREGLRRVDAARIDGIALTEQVQAAAAATQAALTVRFARSQVVTQQQAHAHDPLAQDPRKMRRGIADQITLACHVNSTEGSRRLTVARTLHAELPPRTPCCGPGRSAPMWPGWSLRRPVTSTPRSAAPSTPRSSEPGWSTARPARPPRWPAATPTPPTRRATSAAAAPPVVIVGCRCARRRTR